MTTQQLPAGWRETTLGEVSTFSQGFQISTDFQYPEQKEDFVRFVRIVDYTNEGEKPRYIENPNRCFVNEDDLVMIRYGSQTAGKIVRGIKGVIANNTFQIKTEDNICKNWLYWFLRKDSIYQFLNKDQSSSTMPAITFSQIGKIELLLPPLPEQQAIASVLSAFDDKIELLREENKTLETLGQTIFKEWFGKYSVDEPKSLPEGWRVGKLSDIADFLNGIALQKFPPKDNNHYLPVIKIRELKSGITSQTDKANIEIDKKYIIDNGDVLFSRSGSLEVVIRQHGKGALNQHLFKVSSNEYPKRFYYFWTLYHLPEFKEIASHKATTMGHIQRHHLDNAKVIIPNEKDMEKLNGIFSNLLDKLENNNLQIQSLSTSRDTLLPKLMSGEVRVEF